VYVLVAAAGVRWALLPFESGDLTGFLVPWWNQMKDHGHLASLKTGFSNYAPAYLYLLALLSYLPITPRVATKSLSFFFEGVQAAAFVAIALRSNLGRTKQGRLLALALPLFAPSVLLNGAAWAQCDVIHTAFALLALQAALGERWVRAASLAGLALSFKLQATFFLPALALILAKPPVRRRNSLALLLVPAVFLLSLIPAWLAGRPARELLMIYVAQTSAYPGLTLSAPTLYQWLPGAPSDAFRMIGVIMTVTFLAAGLYLVRQSSRPWGSYEGILTALATTLVCPFLLPSMHERYFYTADVLSMLLPFWAPRRWWVPLAIGAASTACCDNYLFGQPPFEMKYMSLLIFAAIVAVLADWGRTLGLEWGPTSAGEPNE
jgi:Gpi18-like mannosyltransferase